MSLDYQEVLLNPTGKPFTDADNGPLTIGKAFFFAVTSPVPGDENLSGEDKYNLGKIASLVSNEKQLTVEQKSIVKERIGKFFTNSYLVYILWDIIDGIKE